MYERSPGTLLLHRDVSKHRDLLQPVFNDSIKLSNIISADTADVFERQMTVQDSLFMIRQLWLHRKNIWDIEAVSWYRTDTIVSKEQLKMDHFTWHRLCETMQNKWRREHPGNTYQLRSDFGFLLHLDKPKGSQPKKNTKKTTKKSTKKITQASYSSTESEMSDPEEQEEDDQGKFNRRDRGDGD